MTPSKVVDEDDSGLTEEIKAMLKQADYADKEYEE